MTTDITELVQRARINAECGEHLSPAETMELVEALESEKRICATWRKTAEANSEKLEKAHQCITELKSGKVGNALLERENHHVEVVGKLTECIAKLESRTVTFKLPSTLEPSPFAPWIAKAFYQFHKDTVKSCVAVFSDACLAAGIKVEAE